MGLRTASNSNVYDNSYNKVFEAVKGALKNCNFKIKEEDKEKGEINASAGISILSWGERINISIFRLHKNKTRVSIYSGAKAQLIDWGKSEKNVYRLFAALDKILSKR